MAADPGHHLAPFNRAREANPGALYPGDRQTTLETRTSNGNINNNINNKDRRTTTGHHHGMGRRSLTNDNTTIVRWQ